MKSSPSELIFPVVLSSIKLYFPVSCYLLPYPFFLLWLFFLSSKLFRHLCLPLPLSSPLFRGYVKWLRRPGRVGCRTEEALTTLPTSIHQEDSRFSSFSHLFSSACHGSALFLRHANGFTPKVASTLQPLWWCDCRSFRQHCFVAAFLCVKRVWGCCFHVSTDECDSVSDVCKVIVFETCSIVPSTALFLFFMK